MLWRIRNLSNHQTGIKQLPQSAATDHQVGEHPRTIYLLARLEVFPTSMTSTLTLFRTQTFGRRSGLLVKNTVHSQSSTYCTKNVPRQVILILFYPWKHSEHADFDDTPYTESGLSQELSDGKFDHSTAKTPRRLAFKDQSNSFCASVAAATEETVLTHSHSKDGSL